MQPTFDPSSRLLQEIRFYHPNLSYHGAISVYRCPRLAKIWVPSTGNPALDRHIPKALAGRELLVMPMIDMPHGGMALVGIPAAAMIDYISNAVKPRLKKYFQRFWG